MKTPINLLISSIMIMLMTISLSSQELSCAEEKKIIEASEEQVDKCFQTLGEVYRRCKEQMGKDRNAILKQQKLIKELNGKLGKDALKHRAQGAGGASILFIILLLIL